MDVVPLRRRSAELLAELADKNVNRPIAVSHRVAPHPLVDLLPAKYPVRVREQLEDLELAGSEIQAHFADVGLVEIGADRDFAHVRGGVQSRHLAAAVAAKR